MLASTFTRLLRGLLVAGCLGYALPGRAQTDTATHRHDHILSLDPLPALLGEITFSYEQRRSERRGLEYSLGYVYGDLYWKNYNSLNKGAVGFTPTVGIAARVFVPWYTGPGWGQGFYLGPMLAYRFVHLPDVRKQYVQNGDVESMRQDGGETPYEDKVCDYCTTRERINKQVLSLQFMFGTKAYRFRSRVMMDTYFGFGFRAKLISSRIFELYDENIDYNFIFKNYRYGYLVGMPTAHFGIKVGLRSKQ
jgi:hypothetical protein